VDINPRAIECAKLGYQLLLRNKSVTCPSTVHKLDFIQEDAMEYMSRLEPGSFDRILVPRPKQGSLDCDIGKEDCGKDLLLQKLLPLLKPNTGQCHWYDFAADHELPDCHRIVTSIQTMCTELNLGNIVIEHVANVGSVAKRQCRVCLDFRVDSREKNMETDCSIAMYSKD
jgi:tRNA G37 N-methylase Trm5